MSTRAFAIASVFLAATVSAQFGGTDVPTACQNLVSIYEGCAPAGTDVSTGDETAIIQCICKANGFTNAVISCSQAEGDNSDTQAEAQGLEQACSFYANGGTIPTASDDGGFTAPPTTTPTSGSGSNNGGGIQFCSSIDADLSSCWTDENVNPTAAPVASCVCDGDAKFDAYVSSCVDYLQGVSPSEATSVAGLQGYCGLYGPGGTAPTNSGNGGNSSGPTTIPKITFSGSTPTGGSGSQSTGGSQSQTGGSSNPSNTAKPGSGNIVRATVFSTFAAAIFVVFAVAL